MFKTFVILVVSGVSLCFTIEKPTTGCDRGCPKIYNPVCASDGDTYQNMCELEIATCKDANIKLEHRGKCDLYDCQKKFDCPSLLDPVCGTDGKTYSVSLCFTVEKPTTGCDRGCPKIYSPVCASDGKTYPNMCQLAIATCKDGSIRFEHRGKCDADLYDCQMEIECPSLFYPICGTDGNTYSNYCHFRKAVCENPKLKKAHSGRCLESQVRPVLGSDHERVAVPPIHRAAVRPLHTRIAQQTSLVNQEKNI